MKTRHSQKILLTLFFAGLALLSGCDSVGHSYQKAKLQLTTSEDPAEQAVLSSASEHHELELRTLLTDLYLPWGMTFLPDGALLITEKSGALYRYDLDTGEKQSISGLPDTKAWGQGGLMDVVLHPEFEQNQWLYLSYAGLMENRLAATRVARARLVNDKLVDLEILFTALPPRKSGAHFGSVMAFDRNGYLYITSGERHSRPMVQDLSTHIGKIIRLHDDGRIPEDNPFVNRQGALPEIFSYGHRNPQGIAIEPLSQQVWSVEHGPRGGDELNLIQAGKNYGWPVITYGEEYAGGKIGEGTHKEGMEQPVHYYVPSIAPSNMIVYQGDAFPRWRGNILIGALALTHINRLVLQNGSVIHEERLIDGMGIRIKSVEEGLDGFIYLLADDGRLLQLRPKG